ncbi:MAG: hypothetical protein LUQ17_01990 [Methanomicrobiales archaeon]|nr:hypothetical protein [Methanomicrobiales archaeon]
MAIPRHPRYLQICSSGNERVVILANALNSQGGFPYYFTIPCPLIFMRRQEKQIHDNEILTSILRRSSFLHLAFRRK